MNYPTWLKRILLPFEFEDHHLYHKPVDEVDDNEASLRILLGDAFVDRLNTFAPIPVQDNEHLLHRHESQ